MMFIAEELREIMAQLGFKTINEMVGHSEVLNTKEAVDHYKTKGLDFSKIFYRPVPRTGSPLYCVHAQDHGLDKALDKKLIELCHDALAYKKVVSLNLEINNVHRTVGSMLGSELTRRYGPDGLPDNTITLNFTGSAGQSFGAFLPKGITLNLCGDVNDYVGKGLSGGRIIVRPHAKSTFKPEENIIAGNVIGYGGTSGEIFLRGTVGERFCVRNSGIHAVVEGVGDHGCEYMTGGRVVILGGTGRNFAAGMSGGIAYIYQPDTKFEKRCNMGMVAIEDLDATDLECVQSLLEKHFQYTGSTRAEKILSSWILEAKKFRRVMPVEYKKALQNQSVATQLLAAAGE
jgi:glutamate synthase domain-containing protein 3